MAAPPPASEAAGVLETELAAARADPRRQFGRYLLLSELGRGGMGVVYRAWDEPVGRLVALKLLPDEGGEATRRFAREAQAMAALSHPAIVPVFDAGVQAGRRFLAMPLLGGGALKGRLREAGGDLPLPRRVTLVRDVARAVQAAHERGIIHRDLKPENVLLDGDGRPYVADFGLARFVDGKSKLTATGTALGTPAYMSPEQIEGGAIDPRTDVYSLGATLYFALAGRPPFEGATQINVITAVLRQDAAPPSSFAPDVPPALDAITLRCLEKEPGARFASAEALAQALDAWLAGGATTPRAGGRGRAPRVAGALVAVVALVVVVVVGVVVALADSTAHDPVGRPAPTPTATEPLPPAATVPPRPLAASVREPSPRQPGPGPVQGLELVWESPPQGVGQSIVAVSPDGTRVAAGGGLAVTLWALGPDGEVTRRWKEAEPALAESPDVRNLAFSADGRRVFSAGNLTAVIARNVATGETLASNDDDAVRIVWDLALRASGTVLALAGTKNARHPELLHELAGDSLEPVGLSHPPPPRASSIDLSPDGGRLLATNPEPASTGMWLFADLPPDLLEARQAQPSQRLETHVVNGIFASPTLAVAGVRQRRAVFAWDTSTDASEVVEGPAGGAPICLAVTGDSLLSGGYDGAIGVWSLAGGKVTYRQALEGAHGGAPIPCLAITPDGRFVASAGLDGFVRLWRLKRGPDGG